MLSFRRAPARGSGPELAREREERVGRRGAREPAPRPPAPAPAHSHAHPLARTNSLPFPPLLFSLRPRGPVSLSPPLALAPLSLPLAL